ncbi:hypothetical protein [Streptomyces sp. or20]|uniref:hypothetical protein n=1 Tax=Streptomyces sp. or20 TaxID=1828016 RepID=UPI000BF208C1|nr:hypothetical protein [Streptomyces sp. or20]
MGHAVMTHALYDTPQPHTLPVRYSALSAQAQANFDKFMEAADNATTAFEYDTCMVIVSGTTGIDLPPKREIALCACPNCWGCDRIFDANDPDARAFGQSDGYNLGRIQCPHCTDAHRATDEQ